MGMIDVERAIALIAESQHGVLAQAQARRAGASGFQIRRRITNQQWEDLGEEVIGLPGVPRTWRRGIAAATLAGPGGVAGYRTAAALYRLPGFAENRLEIVRLVNARPTSRLCVVHRTRWLPPAHITRIDGIPVTTISRTLFDLAAVVSFPRLRRAVNSAMAMRLVKYEQLDEMLQEMAERGRTGIRPMRKVLAKLGPGKMPSESDLEVEFEEFLESHDEPLPSRQARVGGETCVGRADFRDDGTPILFELDGRTYHQQELDREADAIRDAELAAAGFALLRIPRRLLKENPDWVLARIRELRRRHSVYANTRIPGAVVTRNAKPVELGRGGAGED
jgi:hypothetical protein